MRVKRKEREIFGERKTNNLGKVGQSGREGGREKSDSEGVE